MMAPINNLVIERFSNRKAFFAFAVFFQFAVLLFMIFFYQSLVVGGTDVVLKTVPVDPRDLLRGQYVALRYDISTLDYSLFIQGDLPHPGDNVYVSLVNSGTYWRPVSASKKLPQSGVFLRGEVIESSGGRIAVVYGIESYFVDPEMAEKLGEASRRGDLLMRVTIDENGKGTLRDVAGELPSGESFISPNDSSMRRDALHISSIKQIQLALELYYDANNSSYPASLDLLVPMYLPETSRYPASGANYYYSVCEKSTYHLGADLENAGNVALRSDRDFTSLCPADTVDGADQTSCVGMAMTGRYCFDVAEGPLAEAARLSPPSPGSPGQVPQSQPPAPIMISPPPFPPQTTACPYGLRAGVCNPDSRQYIHITSPNGGESLCLGGDAVIEWESTGLNAVQVLVRPFGSVSTPYVIGSYPAMFNEKGERGDGLVQWSVSNIPEGFGYELVVTSNLNGVSFSDTSDGVFSIMWCEG